MDDGFEVLRHDLKNAGFAVMSASDLLSSHREHLTDAQVDGLLVRIRQRALSITRMADEMTTNPPRRHDAVRRLVPPRTRHESPVPHDHTVTFYESDQQLIEQLVRFVIDGFDAGEAVIIVATPDLRQRLETALRRCGVDTTAPAEQGRYLVADASELLASFMEADVPVAERYDQSVGRLIRTTADKHGGVRVYGEMVAILWAEGNACAALMIEALWNDLRATVGFELLCGYPASVDAGGTSLIAARHGQVVAPAPMSSS